MVGIDARNGKVATRGWITDTDTDATSLAKRFEGLGLAAIVSTDIATDGTLAGPNLEALRAMASASSTPVIASGGIGTVSDLLSLLPLEPLGVSGVIVGRALYDGTVEGVAHTSRPVFCVQYHPEAAPGPHDSRYLFDDFLTLLEARANP